MISIILYGRNDNHGYNLHKRFAISLNCLAEILSAPDDEIVFVDYNTAVTLPSIPEALADTLTRACLAKLRVIRLTPDVHRRVYGERTHLAAVEPLARNVGIRRTDPGNRWILSTNTDMILLPQVSGQSLTSLVGPLADGLYHLPRFELPEAFWEGLPRMYPGAVFDAVENWAGRVQLDEVTLTDPWNLYDAPGDFQLFSRSAVFAVDGFDEAMCHGWHVDSNMARRLSQYFGETRAMEGLRGYHCNHSRVASIYQSTERIQNDAAKYVYDLEDIYLASQRDTWGLPDERLEEIDMGRNRTFHFVERVFQATGTSENRRREVRQTEDDSFWEFSDHVFLHLASALEPLPRTSQIAYFGFNGRMVQQLANFVESSGFRSAITVSPVWKEVVDGFDFVRAAFAPLDQPSVDLNADVLVFDFALDYADKDNCLAFERAPPPLPYLQLCELFLQAVSYHRRETGVSRSVPALFVVSSAFYFPIYQLVEANIAGPSGSFHSRMRQGHVRPDPAPWFDAKWPAYREVIGRSCDAVSVRMRRAQRVIDASVGGIYTRSEPVQTSIENGRLTLGKGWLLLESNGIWTIGPEADLSLFVPTIPAKGFQLDFEFSRIGNASGDHLVVGVWLRGERRSSWHFPALTRRHFLFNRRITGSVAVPADAPSANVLDVKFIIHNLPLVDHTKPHKSQGNGVKLSAISIRPAD